MNEPVFNDWRFVALSPLPAWALVLLFLAAMVALWSAWKGLAVETRASRRRLLVGLRALAALVAFLLVLEPGLELLATTKIRGRVAVLVDRSRSMDLPAKASGPSRADAVKALLARDAGRAGLEERFQVEYWGFAETASPTEPGALFSEEQTDAGTPVPGRDRERTRLVQALEEVADGSTTRPLAGIVLVSDGADNAGLDEALSGGPKSERSRAMSERLKALGAPVFTLDATGGDLQDVAIGQVKREDFAFVRNTVSIEVEVVQRGYGQLQAPVLLEREGQIVAQATAHATEREPGRVTLSFVPDTTGEFAYTVRTPLQADEAVTTNNSRSFVLKVIRDRVRVLHVAGHPSWDERFLRMLLKRDPNVDLISFFILRTPNDLQVGSNEEMSLIPFPTDEIFRKQLDTFDLVVFHDFTYKPYRMAHYLDGLARYVRDGGAFLMIGGPNSFTEGDYLRTPVEEILPVRLSARPPAPDEVAFRAQLTDEGRRHPVTELAPGPVRNEEAWTRLPELHGINRVSLREDAQALAVHPVHTDGHGQPSPVIAVREVGRGRSMAITTDTTWEWAFVGSREGRTQRAYDNFFQNAIRWLVRDPELTQVRLQAERDSFAPGQPVVLLARVRDRDYRPAEGADVTVEVVDTRRGAVVQTRTAVVGDDGVARVEVEGIAEGAYRASAMASLDGRALGVASDAFVVEQSGPELSQPLPRPDLLKFIADATGGEYRPAASTRLSDLPFEDPERVEIGQRRSRPLWDKAWVLALLCALLGTEWFLRRRWGFF